MNLWMKLIFWCLVLPSYIASASEEFPIWLKGTSEAKIESSGGESQNTITTIQILGAPAKQSFDVLSKSGRRFICRGEPKVIYALSANMLCTQSLGATFEQTLYLCSFRLNPSNGNHIAPKPHCLNGVAGIGNGSML